MAKKKSKGKESSKASSPELSFKKERELRRVKRALSQSERFLTKAEDSGESQSVVKGAGQAVKKFRREKEKIERGARVKKRLKSLADKAISGELKFMKQKFLTKPTAKGPAPISARKTLSRFAQSAGPVVREVEREEPVHDNRSQFFNRELAKEERGINKWLS